MAIADSIAPNRELFNTMRDGIGFVDIEGHLVEVNPALCKMVGYTRDELLTMKYQDLTPQEYLAANVEMTKRFSAGQAKTDIYEKEYLHKDGHRVPLHVQAWPLMNPDGVAVGMRAILIDLTEAKRAEAALAVTDRIDVLSAHLDLARKALEDSLALIEQHSAEGRKNGVALDCYIEGKKE